MHDHWRVEFHRDITGNPEKRVRSLSTQFRLRHVVTGCLLRSHSVPLPAWGFKQNEVVCEKKGDKESPFNLWNVENHWNDACKVLKDCDGLGLRAD